ncbi:unnamed protein product [Gordionus sp. m RMFG-2023]
MRLQCDFIMIPLIVCRAYKILDIHLSTISIWHLAFLAFDQYMALKFPHFYMDFSSNKGPSSKGSLTYICVICIMWFISMTFSVPYILGFPDSVRANTFSNHTNLCHQGYESINNLYYNNSKKKSNMNWDYINRFNRYSSPIYAYDNLTIYFDLGDIGSDYLNITNFYLKKILLKQDLNQCTFTPNLISAIVGTVVSFFIPLGLMLYFLFNIIVRLRHKIQSMPKPNQTFINGRTRFSRLVTKIFFPFHKSLTTICNLFLAKTHDHEMAQGGKNSLTIPKLQVKKVMLEFITISLIDDANNVSQNKPRSINSQACEREHRAINYILTILILFLICWIPIFLYFFLLGILQFESPHWVGDLLNWVGYVNSAINPFLYFFMHKGVKASRLKNP